MRSAYALTDGLPTAPIEIVDSSSVREISPPPPRHFTPVTISDGPPSIHSSDAGPDDRILLMVPLGMDAESVEMRRAVMLRLRESFPGPCPCCEGLILGE